MENAVLTSNTSVWESETLVSGVGRTFLRDLARETQKNAKNNTTTTDTKKAERPGRKNAKKIPKNTKSRRENSKVDTTKIPKIGPKHHQKPPK